MAEVLQSHPRIDEFAKGHSVEKTSEVCGEVMCEEAGCQ